MVHTGKLLNLCKKINEADKSKKEQIDGFLNMFGIEQERNPWITKQSVYNQFYSDLVTKVQHGIDVPGTTIRVLRKQRWAEIEKEILYLFLKIRYSET